jgi:hypothetical protein
MAGWKDRIWGQWAMATFIEPTETSDEAKRKELIGEIL